MRKGKKYIKALVKVTSQKKFGKRKTNRRLERLF